MKRGFRGVPRPLLPVMLPVVDQSAGPADQAEDQPSSSKPLPSTSHLTHVAEPTPVPESTSHPPPVVEPTLEPEDPQSQYPSHPHVPEARSLTVEDLLHMVPTLITKRNLDEYSQRINVVLTTSRMKNQRDHERSKSVDKGKRYKRRKEFKGKDFEDISIGFEKVNTGGLGVSTSSGPVSSARGQREGKAPMIVEKTQAPK
ncbi:hypothetical protein Tco_0520630 [Tanacetum coccineum]